MKLLSTTQVSAVAGGSVVTTTAVALASSLSVAASSTIIGFGGAGILAMGIPMGIMAGVVAHHEARSHGGNLGVGGMVGALFSGTSTLVGNAIGWSKPSTSTLPNPNSHRCMNQDCSI